MSRRSGGDIVDRWYDVRDGDLGRMFSHGIFWETGCAVETRTWEAGEDACVESEVLNRKS